MDLTAQMLSDVVDADQFLAAQLAGIATFVTLGPAPAKFCLVFSEIIQLDKPEDRHGTNHVTGRVELRVR